MYNENALNFQIVLSGGGADCVVYDSDGNKVDAGHTDDVYDRLLELLGCTIEQVASIHPEGKSKWGDVFATYDEVMAADAARF